MMISRQNPRDVLRMADSDLQMNVRTTADLSGLKELQAQVATINGDIKSQLAAAGAFFDPVSNSFKSITTEAIYGRRIDLGI